jgi:hypothetical protein
MSWNLFGKKKLQVLATSRNDAVRQALAERHDDGSAVRHVIHFAYPDTDTDLSMRVQLIADLKARGFEVRDAAADNGVVFEHHRAVAADDFDDFTSDLEAWFREGGWKYDGWECAVVSRRN